jgi:hypothetical protein
MTVLVILAVILLTPFLIYKAIHKVPKSNNATTSISEEAKAKAVAELAIINKLQPLVPALWVDMASTNATVQLSSIAGGVGAPYATTADGVLYGFGTKKTPSLLGKLPLHPVRMSVDQDSIFASDMNSVVVSYVKKSKKITTAVFGINLVDGMMFGDNFYAIANSTVQKFTNARLGKSSQSTWNTTVIPFVPIALSADGNIYLLSADGTLATYFKGAPKTTFVLKMKFATGTHIFAYKNLDVLYVFDQTTSTLFTFDKNTGELSASYNLKTSAGIADVSVGSDGKVWILSKDSKIFLLEP